MQPRGPVALLIFIAAVVFPGARAAEKEIYVRVTFKMTWARFCYLDDLFKDRFAELLINEKGRITKPSEVIVMNFDEQCNPHHKRGGNDNQAKVDLYIIKPGGNRTDLDVDMTKQAFKVLYYLMETCSMLQVDKVFETKVENVQSFGKKAVKPPSGYSENEKTWVAIGIGLAVITLLVLVYLCVALKRRDKEIKERVRIKFSRSNEMNAGVEMSTEHSYSQAGKSKPPRVEVHHEAEEEQEIDLDVKL